MARFDSLPPVVSDAPFEGSIYVDGIRLRPVVDAKTGEAVRWDGLYVGMRIPGAYRTSDAAFDAVIDYITDADPWQRNFRRRLHDGMHNAIPGLA